VKRELVNNSERADRLKRQTEDRLKTQTLKLPPAKNGQDKIDVNAAGEQLGNRFDGLAAESLGKKSAGHSVFTPIEIEYLIAGQSRHGKSLSIAK